MTPEHELESEEDEAPEEVTFQSAKTQAGESARALREEAIREKALLKEKRKRKEELFKEQKKKKLLSDDILQSISSLPEKRDESSQQQNQKNKEDKSRVSKKRRKALLPRKRLKNNYKVARLEDYSSNNLLRDRAETFLKRKLFGNSKNRTTANEFLSISNKRSVVKKPAVLFTDNNWGKESKLKAAKLNLRWMNRKKL
ncbi:hypothetical protein GDO81_011789 [Engystomops pustulosus]|uniref:U3 small nucleolar RNA-associated protein NOL7 C-terminal domain-containing protein n=1 Tax=Engystomops pustulosus TaxID=76066 RepID=A0AAV7BGT4_ENGPU|nr:hypothetical protein GDO81_011789 [Engystomops pustulosus]